MESRADHKLLERWNRQRDNKDWDKYLAWTGNPPHTYARPMSIVWLRWSGGGGGGGGTGEWSACNRNCSHETINSSRWHCQSNRPYTRGEIGELSALSCQGIQSKKKPLFARDDQLPRASTRMYMGPFCNLAMSSSSVNSATASATASSSAKAPATAVSSQAPGLPASAPDPSCVSDASGVAAAPPPHCHRCCCVLATVSTTAASDTNDGKRAIVW